MYAFILRHLLMPVYEKIKGKNLLLHLKNYESNLALSKEQLAEQQWQALQILLKHCFEHTQFYPKVWAKVGIHNTDDIKSLADFAKLPVVTKTDITEHYQEFLADNFSNNIKKSTGGSTGQPFSFELNTDSNTRREAIMWRGYGWLGAGLGQKTLYLWGADVGEPTLFKTIKTNLYHKFYNRKMLNSFAMNKNNMIEYVKEIRTYKPKALVSYVNPLYELACYINKNNTPVFSPDTILTGAEPLHDFQRTEIEKAFNCNVYDTFGCREFMLMSAECTEYKKLHTNSDHLVIETLSEQGESVTEQSGDLVITDLYNFGMPLIRYVNGDRATLINEPCRCGNPLPLMSSVDGRKLDIIKTPSGKTIPGELFPHLFKEFKGISRFQVKQSKIDEVHIFIIANEKFSKEDQISITAEINKYAANELNLKFELVEDIPLTVSGKHRVTICEV
ncbi:phenylacetate--CoA ligase family protein [Colwellia demingiae]|uniref:Phenylacetate--CoA ligase family protein n=1 Tax=Colwellia demingiae TaxID=89401 RepID=A0A5C6QQN6_9GAMM|nr:phenylacetate--CoA ligase family protein [Colwellia demingiae]TWX71043.1 phenylacetate--CoA ligase family protein [Colwellia demingiae]